MERFRDMERKYTPRVLGLTATLLNSSCKPYEVEDLVNKLESSLYSKIATVDDMSEVMR